MRTCQPSARFGLVSGVAEHDLPPTVSPLRITSSLCTKTTVFVRRLVLTEYLPYSEAIRYTQGGEMAATENGKP